MANRKITFLAASENSLTREWCMISFFVLIFFFFLFVTEETITLSRCDQGVFVFSPGALRFLTGNTPKLQFDKTPLVQRFCHYKLLWINECNDSIVPSFPTSRGQCL